MKETHSGKAVSSHSKRKNVVLSLVFCVAAVCVALLVLVGPGCFTFYAPHDAKAAIKMFAQKGNSSIDEFPFCS